MRAASALFKPFAAPAAGLTALLSALGFGAGVAHADAPNAPAPEAASSITAPPSAPPAAASHMNAMHLNKTYTMPSINGAAPWKYQLSSPCKDGGFPHLLIKGVSTASRAGVANDIQTLVVCDVDPAKASKLSDVLGSGPGIPFYAITGSNSAMTGEPLAPQVAVAVLEESNTVEGLRAGVVLTDQGLVAVGIKMDNPNIAVTPEQAAQINAIISESGSDSVMAGAANPSQTDLASLETPKLASVTKAEIPSIELSPPLPMDHAPLTETELASANTAQTVTGAAASTTGAATASTTSLAAAAPGAVALAGNTPPTPPAPPAPTAPGTNMEAPAPIIVAANESSPIVLAAAPQISDRALDIIPAQLQALPDIRFQPLHAASKHEHPRVTLASSHEIAPQQPASQQLLAANTNVPVVANTSAKADDGMGLFQNKILREQTGVQQTAAQKNAEAIQKGYNRIIRDQVNGKTPPIKNKKTPASKKKPSDGFKLPSVFTNPAVLAILGGLGMAYAGIFGWLRNEKRKPLRQHITVLDTDKETALPSLSSPAQPALSGPAASALPAPDAAPASPPAVAEPAAQPATVVVSEHDNKVVTLLTSAQAGKSLETLKEFRKAAADTFRRRHINGIEAAKKAQVKLRTHIYLAAISRPMDIDTATEIVNAARAAARKTKDKSLYTAEEIEKFADQRQLLCQRIYDILKVHDEIDADGKLMRFVGRNAAAGSTLREQARALRPLHRPAVSQATMTATA